MGESERGEAVARQRIAFYCARGHVTRPAFAVDAVVPETWDCPRCGYPAGQDPEDTPAAPKIEPYKTHLAYVRERRNNNEGDTLLEEALARLRGDG